MQYVINFSDVMKLVWLLGLETRAQYAIKSEAVAHFVSLRKSVEGFVSATRRTDEMLFEVWDDNFYTLDEIFNLSWSPIAV